jgi:hypothetical protein
VPIDSQKHKRTADEAEIMNQIFEKCEAYKQEMSETLTQIL